MRIGEEDGDSGGAAELSVPCLLIVRIPGDRLGQLCDHRPLRRGRPPNGQGSLNPHPQLGAEKS